MTKKQKLVILSGSSRGLGHAIVNRLLANYRVIGISRSTSGIDNSNYFEYLADLSNSTCIPPLVREIMEQHGTPYGLVNNAASGLDGLLATQSNDEIFSLIDLNLTAPILLTKYVSRQMLEAGEGRIINIGSIIANTGYSGLSVYAATKAGINGFTKSLSRELGRRGITVNSVMPGFMETDMTSFLGDEELRKIANRSALKRNVQVGDVASLVAFLMDETGRNITGTSFTIDAGNTA